MWPGARAPGRPRRATVSAPSAAHPVVSCRAPIWMLDAGGSVSPRPGAPLAAAACLLGQRGGAGRGERRVPQGGPSPAVPGPDHPFDLVPRPGAVEDSAYGACVGLAQPRITDQAAKPACLLRVGPLYRQGHQRGVLALAQIVQAGLSGAGRVVEHAEQVVAELFCFFL